MSISVIEFDALQPHWMLARWDASVPHTLERLVHVLHKKWAKANESQVDEISSCIVFLLVNIENGSQRLEHHTRVKYVVMETTYSFRCGAVCVWDTLEGYTSDIQLDWNYMLKNI